MRLLPILILMLISSSLFAQSTAKDVFACTRMTWFGLDFSKVKLYKGAKIPIIEDVRTRFAPSWNHLFIEEAKKYDLPKFYNKSLVAKDLKSVNEINQTIKTEELITYESYSLNMENISEMVKKYDSNSEEGIGLVYIVESFNKVEKIASVHVTFFDIQTREVLFHERMEGSPRGGGIRNYWAGAFMEILEQSKKNWKKWSKNNI